MVFLLIVVIIFSGILRAILTGQIQNKQTQAWLFLVGIIPLTIFVLAIVLAPVKYTIIDSMIIVNRLGTNIIIPIENIEDIKKQYKKELGLRIRLFGSGGSFGGFGLFYASRIGIFNAYITNTKTLVLIKYDHGKKILLSPERPEEFLDAVNQVRSRLSGVK
jgi:hypothetical protein